jgi:hypothetical protein
MLPRFGRQHQKGRSTCAYVLETHRACVFVLLTCFPSTDVFYVYLTNVPPCCALYICCDGLHLNALSSFFIYIYSFLFRAVFPHPVHTLFSTRLSCVLQARLPAKVHRLFCFKNSLRQPTSQSNRRIIFASPCRLMMIAATCRNFGYLQRSLKWFYLSVSTSEQSTVTSQHPSPTLGASLS